ncbi:hypothetical protein ACIOWI_34920 [Streptomyces sp. NPDC087659]|uniref:hypothetical protein n=1 Tax=Streptomyces sp. NPDC087659 TaxID=3365801 RepID=UPI003827FDC0
MAGHSKQQSSQESAQKGIMAMDMADDGIGKIMKDVAATGEALFAQGYKGSDGRGFQALLLAWLERAQFIRDDLANMKANLQETKSKQAQAQVAAGEMINGSGKGQASLLGDKAFGALT